MKHSILFHICNMLLHQLSVIFWDILRYFITCLLPLLLLLLLLLFLPFISFYLSSPTSHLFTPLFSLSMPSHSSLPLPPYHLSLFSSVCFSITHTRYSPTLPISHYHSPDKEQDQHSPPLIFIHTNGRRHNGFRRGSKWEHYTKGRVTSRDEGN